MVIARNQDNHLGAIIRGRQVILDLVLLGKGIKVLRKIGDSNVKAFQVPLQPRKEHATTIVYVIVGVQYPAIVRD